MTEKKILNLPTECEFDGSSINTIICEVCEGQNLNKIKQQKHLINYLINSSTIGSCEGQINM